MCSLASCSHQKLSQDINERVQKRCLKLLYPALSCNQALNKCVNVFLDDNSSAKQLSFLFSTSLLCYAVVAESTIATGYRTVSVTGYN